MGLTSGFKQTEVGVIPEDWDVRSLRSELDGLDAGVSVRSVDGGDETYGFTPAVLKTSAVANGRFLPHEAKTIVPADVNRARVSPQADTIIVSRMNTPGLVGDCGYVERDFPNLFLPDRLWMTRVRHGSHMSVKWLAYVLRSEQCAPRIKAAATGTSGSMKNISKEALLALPVAFPSNAEQRAIATVLSDAAALIESLEQVIAKKRLVMKSGMQELLTGNRRLPEFNGPWQAMRLGELFKFSGGFSASRDQLSADGYCYLHYGDIHKSTRAFIDVRTEYPDIPKLDIQLDRISPASLLDEGDVVFVDASEDDEGTSKHVVIFNKGDMAYISGLHTIVAKAKTDDLEHDYRRYCFQTAAIRKQFYFFAVGTKVSGISKTNIAKVELSFPQRSEQRAIAAILGDMDAEIAALEVKLEKARLVRQGMLQNLLTGRIRLS